MNLVVQKFGGTSMANKSSIKLVAEKIKNELDKKNKVIAVVSAPSGITNHLQNLMFDINSTPPKKELDMILSLGENISISLLSTYLSNINIKSTFKNSYQIGIYTDDNHNNAKINSINKTIIMDILNEFDVLVIPGFQGISEKNEITTLGRGGSDITALALAATLNLKEVDIFTDVDYVYSSDPKLVKNLKINTSLSYDEMIELSASGSKVLHTRCIEIADKYNIQINLKSTFSNNLGSIIKNNIEKSIIKGISYQDNNMIVNFKVNDLSELTNVLDELSKRQININIVSESKNYVSLSILSRYSNQIKSIQDNSNLENINFEFIDNLSRISIIGNGIKNNYGVINKVVKIMNDEKINILMISCSEINISILIEKNYSHRAINILHKELIEKEVDNYEKV